MAIVGEAYVDVHATTRAVTNEIRDGLREGVNGQGTEAGRTFTREFESESGPGISAVGQRLGQRIAAAFGDSGTNAGKSFTDKFRAMSDRLRNAVIPGPDLNIRALEAKIAQVTARLDGLRKMEVTPKVSADIMAAEVNLARLEAKLAEMSRNEHRIKVNVDQKGLSDSIVGVGALFRAIQVLALPVAVIGATPAVAALGAAAVEAVGALYLLPAAAGVAAVGVGTLVVGLSHMADALGPAGTPAQLKKVNEAMAALSPQARATAMEIRGLTDEWTALRTSVQDRLFAGVSAEVQPLASTYLPLLTSVLGFVADGFNRNTLEIAKFLQSRGAIDSITIGMGNVGAATSTLTNAMPPLARAFVDIFAVGSMYVGDLAQGVVDLTNKFANWVAQARASGELNRIIERALVVIGQLVDLAINLGRILGAIFDAGATAGGNFLGVLVRVTDEIARFLSSAQGQEALVALFRAINETVTALMPGIVALGGAIARSIIILGPVLPQIGDAFSALAISAGPVITGLAYLGSIVLPPLVWLLTQLSPILGPIAFGFLAMGAAVGPIVKIVGVVTKIVEVFRLAAVAQGLWTAAVWLFNAAMAANPITLVIIAIAALVAGLILAYQHSETFRAIVDAAMAKVVEAFHAVGDALAAVVQWFRDLGTNIGASLTAFGESVGRTVDGVVTWFTELPSRIGTALSTLGSTVTTAAVDAWHALDSGAQRAVDATVNFVAELPNRVAYALGFLIGALVRGAIDAWDGFSNAITTGWDATYAFFASLPDRIVTTLIQLGVALLTSGTNSWNRFTEGVMSAWNATYAFFAGLPDRIIATLITLGLSLFNSGSDALTRFLDGVSSRWDAVNAFFTGLGPRIIATLISLGVSLYTSGQSTMRGFLDGIDAGYVAVMAWLDALPDRIGAFFVDAGTWLMNTGNDIINGLVAGLQAADDAVWAWLAGLLDSFIQGFKDAMGIASPSTLFAGFGTDVMMGFLNGLQAMVEFILGFVIDFVARFITGFGRMLTFWGEIWTAIDTLARTVWAAIGAYFDTAITAFVTAFTTNFTAVRTFWASVWDAIWAYGQQIWNAIWNFFGAGFQAYRTLFESVFNAVYTFWSNIWNAIFAFGQQVWNVLVAFYQSGFTNWRGLFEGLMNAVNAFWQLIWNAIRAFGEQIWNAIYAYFQAGFNAFYTLIQSVMNAVSAFWTSIWNAIRTLAVTVWNGFYAFITSGLNAFHTLITTVMNAISAFWTSVWNAIENLARTIWNNISTFFTNALNTFSTFWTRTITSIRDNFNNILSGIVAIAERIWTDVRNIFNRGVNLVIDAVNWPINKINGVFGISIPTIPRLALGGDVQDAGRVQGGLGGTRTDQVITKLSREEHVWSAEEVRAAGGHAAVRQLRAAVLRNRADTSEASALAIRRATQNPAFSRHLHPQFATGGNLSDLVPALQNGGQVYQQQMYVLRQQFPGLPLISGPRPGAITATGNVSMHSAGKAVDVPPRADVFNWIKSTYGRSIFELIFSPMGNNQVYRGANHFYGEPTRGDHWDHVHWSMQSMSGPGLALSALGNVAAAIMPSFDGILEGALSAVRGMFGGLPGWWPDLAGSMVRKAWDGMKQKATDAWNNLFGGAGGGAAGATGPVVDQVRAVANSFGWGTGAQWDAINWIIQKESGWNPNAANPTSSARGLFQKMTSVNGPVEPTAGGQAQWGLNYIRSRYGSPTAAQAFWQSHGWYDEGGWLPRGTTLAVNNTRGMEAVIPDPVQSFTRAFDRVFRRLSPHIADAISNNISRLDAEVAQHGGERSLEERLRDVFYDMSRRQREALSAQYPLIVEAIKSRDRDVVDAIQATFVPLAPLPAPTPIVQLPTEMPGVVSPEMPVGAIGASFRDAISQLAPELSFAISAGAGDQIREFGTAVLNNTDRVQSIADAMGTPLADVRGILAQLVDSVAPVVQIPPVPVPPQIQLPTWLEDQVAALRDWAAANVRVGNSAGDRLETLGDLNYRLVRNFEHAFPALETAMETSRVDTNRVLADQASQLLTYLQGLSPEDAVALLNVLDGQSRQLDDMLAASQQLVSQDTSASTTMTIADGAFRVTVQGNADSVTVGQMQDSLMAFGDQILHEYEGRT